MNLWLNYVFWLLDMLILHETPKSLWSPQQLFYYLKLIMVLHYLSSNQDKKTTTKFSKRRPNWLEFHSMNFHCRVKFWNVSYVLRTLVSCFIYIHHMYSTFNIYQVEYIIKNTMIYQNYNSQITVHLIIE